MELRRLLLVTALGLSASACVSPTAVHYAAHGPVWQTEQKVSGTSRLPACALVSDGLPYASGAGLERVQIAIHSDGLVSLRAHRDRFDTNVRQQIGIRVDDFPPVMAPQNGQGPNELTFSAEDSARLLDQFKAGKVARVQLALVPSKELLTGVYSLDHFDNALLEYRMCEVVRSQQARGSAKTVSSRTLND